LRKYQEAIERYFEVVEFKAQQPLESSKGGRPEVFALLTEPQANFALTLLRNNAKTMQRKAELIADFERAKAILRSQLESQFNQKPVQEDLAKIAELTALLTDWETKHKQAYDKMQYYQARAMGADMLTRLKKKPEAFTEDSELLWLISGIASKSYFVSRCREDLQYGVDYLNGGRKGSIKLTPYAALQMLLNFRSRKGVQARYLPETAEVSVKGVIGTDDSKINRRKVQQS
jgi:hypothetical protein